MALCDYLQTSLATLLLVLHLFTVIYSVNGLTCSNCVDVALTEHCRDTTICGEDERCYTQEYKDHKGQQAFRLGCTSQQICTLYFNAKTLFGKRGISSPPPSDKCYECCSTDECNATLCHGSQTILSTAVPQVTSLSSISNCHTLNGCPEMFIPFKDFCYVFLPGIAHWSDARSNCKSLGADLVSITSKEENDFLARGLTTLKASLTWDYWTAGVYSHRTQEWEWADGSHFNYTNWWSSAPSISSSSHSSDRYIVMLNPAYTPSYKNATWTDGGDSKRSVICKKNS